MSTLKRRGALATASLGQRREREWTAWIDSAPIPSSNGVIYPRDHVTLG